MFFLAKAVAHFNKNGRGIRSRIGLIYLPKGLDASVDIKNMDVQPFAKDLIPLTHRPSFLRALLYDLLAIPKA